MVERNNDRVPLAREPIEGFTSVKPVIPAKGKRISNLYSVHTKCSDKVASHQENCTLFNINFDMSLIPSAFFFLMTLDDDDYNLNPIFC